jgi:hypothetical protein
VGAAGQVRVREFVKDDELRSRRERRGKVEIGKLGFADTTRTSIDARESREQTVEVRPSLGIDPTDDDPPSGGQRTVRIFEQASRFAGAWSAREIDGEAGGFGGLF